MLTSRLVPAAGAPLAPPCVPCPMSRVVFVTETHCCLTLTGRDLCRAGVPHPVCGPVPVPGLSGTGRTAGGGQRASRRSSICDRVVAQRRHRRLGSTSGHRALDSHGSPGPWRHRGRGPLASGPAGARRSRPTLTETSPFSVWIIPHSTAVVFSLQSQLSVIAHGSNLRFRQGAGSTVAGPRTRGHRMQNWVLLPRPPPPSKTRMSRVSSVAIGAGTCRPRPRGGPGPWPVLGRPPFPICPSFPGVLGSAPWGRVYCRAKRRCRW